MIIPILHRILVKPFKLEDVDKDYARAKAAGIFVDFGEKVREQAAVDKGLVIAVGSTAFRDFGTESPIKVGDEVAFARYGGKAMKDPETEEDFVVLNDEDVIAILTKEPLDG